MRTLLISTAAFILLCSVCSAQEPMDVTSEEPMDVSSCEFRVKEARQGVENSQSFSEAKKNEFLERITKADELCQEGKDDEALKILANVAIDQTYEEIGITTPE